MSEVHPQWLGRLSYRWAYRLQHLRRQAVLAGHAPEALWLLEHDPVITTGRRTVERLPGQGTEVVHTERGGLATWHGPGQIVGYAIVDVAGRGGSVKGTICAVEQALIDWLGTLSLQAQRRPGYPGVWVDGSKVGAVGMHFRKGVSMHGFALNLDCDLQGFNQIVPCGIHDAGVTSVGRLLGWAPTTAQAADPIGKHLVDTLGLGG